MDNVSLSATSAREVLEAKSLTDVEWCSDVHCIPSSAKGSREPDWQCCEPALKKESLWMCVGVLGVLGDWLPLLVPEGLERLYLFFT